LKNIFRFASFEADRERYQLRHGIRAIKLERIPLELLFLLLEHNGKLVSREQIATVLWGSDVHLDTERSINTAIRKIRKALEDDPHRPQFIETIVGKGYRFAGSLIPDNEIRDPTPDIQSAVPSFAEGTNGEGGEIRLRGFFEDIGGTLVLTCDVMANKTALGRLPLMELEMPANVTLPLKPVDRLLLKLHGVRVTLTPAAAQALHAFSISVLQNGLRTRVTDSVGLSEEPCVEPLLADPKTSQFSSLQKSPSAAIQQAASVPLRPLEGKITGY
jgi:DNA-binding winged helix-turn-helix (wHTH) protein